VNKEQLRSGLRTAALVLLAFAAFMNNVSFGPLAFVKGWILWVGNLLNAEADSDAVLDAIVGSGMSSRLTAQAVQTPAHHELAMLHAPTEEHKERFATAVNESVNA
jgi:ornithine cyclodeaminase/alanine dehydrogenase-like protein (mu-crystallin family)